LPAWLVGVCAFTAANPTVKSTEAKQRNAEFKNVQRQTKPVFAISAAQSHRKSAII
jgi:hypothetical protein